MDNSKKTASYKFNKNLLGLSNSKVLDQAKKEWDLLHRSKYEESKKCICQHTIKYCNFYLNNINGNMIIVGSACSKKFGLIQKETSRKSFPKSLIEIIKKGEYENIEDLFKYSAEVREIYIQYFKNKIKDCDKWPGIGNRYYSRKTVKEELEELEKKYKINWLLDLKIDLIEKMKNLKELIKVAGGGGGEGEGEGGGCGNEQDEEIKDKYEDLYDKVTKIFKKKAQDSLDSTHYELIKAGFRIGADGNGEVGLISESGSPVFRYPEELDACYEYLKNPTEKKELRKEN